MGPSGWVGVYLDDKPDWAEVAELLTDGYRLIAPKKLLKEMDAQSS
jgi:predicted DNA-binding protein (MmcQ/YjbR family)